MPPIQIGAIMALARGPAAERSRWLPLGIGGTVSLLAAAGLMLAAMLLPVVQSSDATQTGYAIQRDEQELADLSARTDALQAQVAQLGSMSRIRAEAARLGMTASAGQGVNVSVSIPAPAGVLLPRSYLPTPVTVPAAGGDGR